MAQWQEYSIWGRWRKETKLRLVTRSIADNSKIGWHYMRSLDEAIAECERLKKNSAWEMENKKRKAVQCGLISVDTEYYSDYDLLDLCIRVRTVSSWEEVGG